MQNWSMFVYSLTAVALVALAVVLVVVYLTRERRRYVEAALAQESAGFATYTGTRADALGAKTLTTTNGYTVTVDADVYERVKDRPWYYHRKERGDRGSVRSASRTVEAGGHVTLKHLVLGIDLLDPGYVKRRKVMHVNGNPLDCRRDNLRVKPRSSTYSPGEAYLNAGKLPPGVRWVPSYRYYLVEVAGRTVGTYQTREAAIDAFKRATRPDATLPFVGAA